MYPVPQSITFIRARLGNVSKSDATTHTESATKSVDTLCSTTSSPLKFVACFVIKLYAQCQQLMHYYGLYIYTSLLSSRLYDKPDSIQYTFEFPAILAYLNADAIELAAATDTTTIWGTTNIGAGKPFADTQAKWIWYHAGAQSSSSPDTAATFTATVMATAADFDDQGTAAAQLHIIVDDTADVYLNGAKVGSVQYGWRPYEYIGRPLSLTLAKGTNTLSIRAVNTGGPAGLIASLVSVDGNTVLARTNGAWTYRTDSKGAPGKSLD